MPTAWSRPGQIPADDKNPLANLLNYNDIAAASAQSGTTIREALPGVIHEQTGVDLSNPQDWPIVGDIAEALSGVEDGDLNDLGTWANSLLSFFRPVPGVQAASVVDTNPNLILAPDFQSPAALATAEQGWVWDNSAGRDSVGTLHISPSGYITEVVSNEISVVAGQNLDLSIWVKWSGLTYTGSGPFLMGVTRYLNRSEVGSSDEVIVASPAATQDWTQLSKTQYTVPGDCDEIRLRLKVGANATAGEIWFDDASVIKTQPGSGWTGNLIDNTIQGLENVNAPGWDLTDLFISMLKMFRISTDHGARITLLETLQSTGNKINDEFLRVGTTMGANWHQTYIGGGGGTWGTDGDYAFWTDAGFADREARCRYIGFPSTTATDTQRIIAVLGSKSEDVLIYHSYIDLYGRWDAGETNWIRARFSSNGDVTISRSIDDVITDLDTATGWNEFLNPQGVKPPGGGSTIELLCGTGSGDRFFEAKINGVTVLATSDLTSNLGAGFRGYGQGAKAEGSLLIIGQATPGSLNAWAAIDN